MEERVGDLEDRNTAITQWDEEKEVGHFISEETMRVIRGYKRGKN